MIDEDSLPTIYLIITCQKAAEQLRALELITLLQTLALNAARRSERACNCIGFSSDPQVAPRV